MIPRMEALHEKKLVGKKMTMSLTNNKTGELWKCFMQDRKEITNNLGSEMISMKIYGPSYFMDFDPSHEFEKWAAIEVANFGHIPIGMDGFTLPGGLYAVFEYNGSDQDRPIFQYIFKTWLPNSNYTLDERPHFEILGEKYKNNDPTSEEEIWIPIKDRR